MVTSSDRQRHIKRGGRLHSEANIFILHATIFTFLTLNLDLALD
jgi:hypothetical protein